MEMTGGGCCAANGEKGKGAREEKRREKKKEKEKEKRKKNNIYTFPSFPLFLPLFLGHYILPSLRNFRPRKF